ncbi:MAG: hypothetical protein Q4F70_03745 [Clostridia bacterium]|nr:hypothetical protein [Clostridia bacterium]
MDDRGRLSFAENEAISGDKKLKKMKKQWESFAENESDSRDRYLRELEISFSMNEMVDGTAVKENGDGIADVFVAQKG